MWCAEENNGNMVPGVLLLGFVRFLETARATARLIKHRHTYNKVYYAAAPIFSGMLFLPRPNCHSEPLLLALRTKLAVKSSEITSLKSPIVLMTKIA